MKRKMVGQSMIALGLLHLAIGNVSVASAQRTEIAERGEQMTAGRATVLRRPVTLTLQDATVESAIEMIAATTGVRIQYQGRLSDQSARRVTLRLVATP